MDFTNIIKIINRVLIVLGVAGLVLLYVGGKYEFPDWTLYPSLGMVGCGALGIMGILSDSEQDSGEKNIKDVEFVPRRYRK